MEDREQSTSSPQQNEAEENSGSGTNSATSPAIDPTTLNAMNSSIISTLDLGESPTPENSTQSTTTAAKGPLRLRESDEKSSAGDAWDDRSNDPNAARLAASSATQNSTYAPPLAPHDVLASAHQREERSSKGLTPSSSGATLSIPPSSSSTTLGADASFGEADSSFLTQGGGQADDSALNALMEAHTSSNAHHADVLEERQQHSSPHRPSKRDASFGLDPDVDKQHSVRGQALASHLFSSPSRSSHSRRGSIGSAHGGHHHHHQHHDHGTISDFIENHAPSHTTASTGAPKTSETGMESIQTVPTVSATGVPRFLPRHRSRSRSRSASVSDSGDERSRKGRGRGRRGSVSASQASTSLSSSDTSPPAEMQPSYAPSGSLTLAIFSSGIGWRRRSYLLLASVFINLGLPFINGVMLGFGEIFARSIVAPWIGLAPAAININAPAGRSATATNVMGSTSTSGVGLRHAGKAAEQAERPPRR